jgi:hypothetical protein
MNSIDQKEELNNHVDPEVERILQEMLDADETITARAVAKKHPAIKHASSVARGLVRSELLAPYQERQNQFRERHARTLNHSRKDTTSQIAQKGVSISEQDDVDMVRILQEMLETDVTMTARGVAKKHPFIQHASSITRHQNRSDLLARYQAMQNERRAWLKRLPKYSRAQTASQLADKDLRIAELERQIEILRVSHLAMIRAVGELGGTSRWLRFFEDYRDVGEELKKLGLLPDAEIMVISTSKGERLDTEVTKG